MGAAQNPQAKSRREERIAKRQERLQKRQERLGKKKQADTPGRLAETGSMQRGDTHDGERLAGTPERRAETGGKRPAGILGKRFAGKRNARQADKQSSGVAVNSAGAAQQSNKAETFNPPSAGGKQAANSQLSMFGANAVPNKTDYKGMLAARAQRRNEKLEYRVLSQSGPAHEPIFQIGVFIDGEKIGGGEGSRVKDAEQAAAHEACAKLGIAEK